MAAANKSIGRVDKLLAKLEKSVQDKKYYEAHQMYRTLYFRYESFYLLLTKMAICRLSWMT